MQRNRGREARRKVELVSSSNYTSPSAPRRPHTYLLAIFGYQHYRRIHDVSLKSPTAPGVKRSVEVTQRDGIFLVAVPVSAQQRYPISISPKCLLSAAPTRAVTQGKGARRHECEYLSTLGSFLELLLTRIVLSY